MTPAQSPMPPSNATSPSGSVPRAGVPPAGANIGVTARISSPKQSQAVMVSAQYSQWNTWSAWRRSSGSLAGP